MDGDPDPLDITFSAKLGKRSVRYPRSFGEGYEDGRHLFRGAHQLPIKSALRRPMASLKATS